jgi:hypothetical protein
MGKTNEQKAMKEYQAIIDKGVAEAMKLLRLVGDDVQITQTDNVIHVPLALWKDKSLYRKPTIK